MKLLRRPAATEPVETVVVPAPRVADDVLDAVLAKDRRRQQVAFEGPDRRRR